MPNNIQFLIALTLINNHKLDSCNYVKCIKTEGLSHPTDDHQERGDLFIHFKISFPEHVPKVLRNKLAAIFDEIDEWEEQQKEKSCVREC